MAVKISGNHIEHCGAGVRISGDVDVEITDNFFSSIRGAAVSVDEERAVSKAVEGLPVEERSKAMKFITSAASSFTGGMTLAAVKLLLAGHGIRLP